MPEDNPYRIFVSHAWQDHDEFDRFFEFVEESENFFYTNTGQPDALPEAAQTKQDFRQAMGLQIAASEVVVILSGMYDGNSDWLQFQMELAKRLKKPMVAIKPFGLDPVPPAVEEKVDEVIRWDTGTIVDAVKIHARGQPTNRFEVIDFPGFE